MGPLLFFVVPSYGRVHVGKRFGVDAIIAPPFMEATDASRLVCVVVVSYQEYSLTYQVLKCSRWSVNRWACPIPEWFDSTQIRERHRRGLSRLRDRPQLRLRANKLPSPNHCAVVISCWSLKISQNHAVASWRRRDAPHALALRMRVPDFSLFPTHPTSSKCFHLIVTSLSARCPSPSWPPTQHAPATTHLSKLP